MSSIGLFYRIGFKGWLSIGFGVLDGRKVIKISNGIGLSCCPIL